MPETSTADWLKEHAPEGARIGYDPWLHTRDWVTKAKEALAEPRRRAGRRSSRNPIDAVWTDRPEASKAHLVVQPDQYAGKSAAEKRTGDRPTGWPSSMPMRRCCRRSIRSPGRSTSAARTSTHTPVALAYALVHADGTADLFVASEKIGADVRQHLGNGVRLHERAAFESALAELKGKTVAVDPERAVAAIFEALEKAGAKIVPMRDPTILPKAIKNPAEIAGQKAAQARDGAAIVALPPLDRRARRRRAASTNSRRRTSSKRFAARIRELRDLSFDTISGAGPNGAIVHYQVEREDQPQARDGHALSGRFGRPISRRHHRHHPHRADRRADRRDARPLHPRAQGPYRDRHRGLPQGHARLASSTASPAGHCGKRASITPTAPATASAASSRSTKGRSASRRSEARRRRRRAAPGRHDPLQRARLLQDRRIRHPHRESGAGRRRARSRARRRRCSASRR